MKKELINILLVDDNSDILEALKIILEDEEYNVATLLDGKQIQQAIKAKKPDLIILDMLLSGIDGRDLIKILKNQEDTKNIPIILTSAHPQIKSRWRESGADNFIEKPYDIENLISLIKNINN